MNTHSFNGADFKAVFQTEEWKIGILRYSERFSRLGCFERHLKTPEVFVLLEGEATLYEKNDENEITSVFMQKNTVYEIEIAKWHHIVVSEDAYVLVVENADTSKENTQKVML